MPTLRVDIFLHAHTFRFLEKKKSQTLPHRQHRHVHVFQCTLMRPDPSLKKWIRVRDLDGIK
jgi:hypothetical protein